MRSTENLTIMFTDIVGFTEKTSRLSRQQHKQLLLDHDRMLLPILKHFGGKRIKSVGDGMLAAFKSPTDAVRCAMAMHDQLFVYNQDRSELERIDIRTALNTGEVQVEKNDIFGDAVNLASRLEGITPGGEVYFTQALYLAMNKAEVASEELGGHEFKGIDEVIDVFRVPQSRDAPDQPPYGGDLSFQSMSLMSSLGRSDNDLVSGRVSRGQLLIGGGVTLLVVVALLLIQSFSGAPEDVVELKAEARAMLEANDLEQARELAEKNLETNPEDVEGLMLVGHVHMAKDKIADAIRSYRSAIRLDPDQINNEEMLGHLLRRLARNSQVNNFVVDFPESVFVDELVSLTDHSSSAVRESAAELLRRIGKENLIDPVDLVLADLAEQDECEPRLESIREIRRLKAKKALPALRQLADVSLVEKVKTFCYQSELSETIAELEGRTPVITKQVSGKKSDDESLKPETQPSEKASLSNLVDKIKELTGSSATDFQGGDK